MAPSDLFLPFERAKFRTRLPRGHFYTAGHMWLHQAEPGLWHIGLTRFALRMLGEPVDLDFEVKPDAAVAKGDVVGWFEGFKAVSDLYSPIDARFAGGNPALDAGLDPVHRSSYERGWLFDAEVIYRLQELGEPVVEIPADLIDRETGVSSVGWRTPFRMLADLFRLRRRLRANPLSKGHPRPRTTNTPQVPKAVGNQSR